jgi:two-component system cell cycle response regulator
MLLTKYYLFCIVLLKYVDVYQKFILRMLLTRHHIVQVGAMTKEVKLQKILVVDDSLVIRKIVRSYLVKIGYEVVEADDGQTALDYLQKEPIQIVITDWVMKQISGLELTRYIRNADFPYYIYIIMVSAQTNKDDVVRGLEAGADDYLIKPFDENELLARVAIGNRILKLESELRVALAEQQRLASNDELTGLLNRRYFMELAEREWAYAQRYVIPLSVVMLDIDHFKRINDAHGHTIGDQVLREVALCCQTNLRKVDIIGRYGGEEFIVFLPNTSITDACVMANRLCKNTANASIETSIGALSITVSLGVVTLTNDCPDLRTLIDRADQALYEAKRTGRNRVVAWSEKIQ